ncbi:hypothetical protein HYS03_02585 [Candidatus Woesebacteria bacterium]|nr:hypothetical protein [Candidatus Woesebacteria bacterium]QQG47916.1 MAG: hypothetical protein HY044_02415 [Candidatus Woesebacteria bacterium]
MQTLAAIFVSIITFANTLAPTANLPKVLGVQIAEKGSDSSESTSGSSNSGSTSTNNDSRGGDSHESSNSQVNTQLLRKVEGTKEIKDIRDDFKSKMMELEQEHKASQSAFLEKRKEIETEFKNKLETIKDEHKKEVVTTIDQNISNHNQNWAQHWDEVLTRLTNILDKIKSRRDKAQAAGNDVTSVNAAIVNAESAIAAAQASINNQSTKTYSINITTDDKLGPAVSSTVQSFKTDVKSVIDAINAARRAIQDAIKALQTIKRVDEDEGVPTPSAIPTTSPSSSPSASPAV